MFRYKIDITIIATCFREPSAMNVRHYTRGLKIGVLHPRAEDICISHRKHYKVVSVLGTNGWRRSRGTLLSPYRYIFSSPVAFTIDVGGLTIVDRFFQPPSRSSFRDWRNRWTNEIILRYFFFNINKYTSWMEYRYIIREN